MKKSKLTAAILSILICGSLSTFAIVSDSEKKPSEWTVKTQKTCPRCDGKGYVNVRESCSCSGNGCPICDYKGYIETRTTCPECDGSGRITIEQKH